MINVHRNLRRATIVDSNTATLALEEARACFREGKCAEGCDLYEQLIELIPQQSTALLAELHAQYQAMPNNANRYALYVSRYFDFEIKPTDKVLDIGSGHEPFPYATHLGDIALTDDQYGRHGVPFKYVAGKPVFECNVEDMPFGNKEFDFIYCSHVLEHTIDPERACRELMRVGRRGYIETPTRGKDLWLNTAKMSNHHWAVELRGKTLHFTEYSAEELQGFDCNVILDMNCYPQTDREKALAALLRLKSKQINVMLYWEDTIEYEVHRRIN